MSKITLYAFKMLVFLCFPVLHAQNDTIKKPTKTADYNKLMDSNFKDSISTKFIDSKTDSQEEIKFSGQWVVGAGINIIQDPGDQNISSLFKSKNNHFGSPFFVSGEYIISNKFSFSTTFLLNKYQSGKDVQELTIQDNEPTYMAVDFAAKMFFRKILYKHVFTPYATLGTGIRSIDAYQAVSQAGNLIEVPKTRDITINVGIGAYYWLGRTWGLNFNYISKFALKVRDNKDFKTNHLVPTLGVFYRFNNKYFK